MVRERLRRLRLRLLADHPFFGTLLLHAPLRETFEIPTMATDGYAIYYNPTFVEALTDDEALGVLLHEVLHAAYGHLPRRGERDPLRWNVVADIVVNGIVDREGVGRLPQGALRDPALQDLPVEEVYALLPEPPPLPQPDLLEGAPSQYESLDEPGGAEKGQGRDREEEGEQEQAGGGEGKGDKGASNQGQGLEDGSGKALAPSNLRDYWRRALREAQVAVETVYRRHSQSQGALGASREYREAVEGRLDWRSLLWRFLTPTPTNFGGLDRRFVHQRLYLEALEEWNVRVHVAVDTSGSIGNETLRRFLGEIRAILRAYPRTQAQLYYADAQLYGPYLLEPEGPWAGPQGGGGTDFRPFFRHLEAQDDPLGEILAVYLTDGYGDFPETPPQFPVLWVVAPGGLPDANFPFGEVARLWD